jgi:hypothetical protein
VTHRLVHHGSALASACECTRRSQTAIKVSLGPEPPKEKATNQMSLILPAKGVAVQSPGECARNDGRNRRNSMSDERFELQTLTALESTSENTLPSIAGLAFPASTMLSNSMNCGQVPAIARQQELFATGGRIGPAHRTRRKTALPLEPNDGVLEGVGIDRELRGAQYRPACPLPAPMTSVPCRPALQRSPRRRSMATCRPASCRHRCTCRTRSMSRR